MGERPECPYCRGTGRKSVTAIEFLSWDARASLVDLRHLGRKDAVSAALSIAAEHGLVFDRDDLGRAFDTLRREEARHG